MSPKHRMAVVAFLALILWSALWHALLAPNPKYGLGQNLLLSIAPVLIPGLLSFVSLRGALLGMGFAALLMFCHGVMVLVAGESLLAWPVVVLAAITVLLLGGRQKAAAT